MVNKKMLPFSRRFSDDTRLWLEAAMGADDSPEGMGMLIEYNPDKNKILDLAIQNGEHEVVANLLFGAESFRLDSNHYNLEALLKLAKENDAIKTMLEFKFEVQKTNLSYGQILLEASRKGHDDIIKDILKHNLDINCRNSLGMTALMWAAKEGHTSIVKTILMHRSFFGRRPLDVDLKDFGGRSALFYAAEGGHLEIVKLLGDAAKFREKEQPSPLFSCAVYKDKKVYLPLCVAAKNGHVNVLEELLCKRSGMVNEKDSNGFDALTHACFSGQIESAEALLSHGADLYGTTARGLSRLGCAIQTGKLEMVVWLLKKGAKINDFDQNEQTHSFPLMYAVSSERPEITKLLLDRGAKINQKSNSGRTPLDFAITQASYNQRNVVSSDKQKQSIYILIQRGAKVTDRHLEKAIQLEDLRMVELLIERGVKVSWRHLNLAQNQNLELFKFLIETGFKTKKALNGTEKTGARALGFSIVEGHEEIEDILIKKGVSIQDTLNLCVEEAKEDMMKKVLSSLRENADTQEVVSIVKELLKHKKLKNKKRNKAFRGLIIRHGLDIKSALPDFLRSDRKDLKHIIELFCEDATEDEVRGILVELSQVKMKSGKKEKIKRWIIHEHVQCHSEELELGHKYLCPISMTFMTDPVQDPSGHIYERSAIENWLNENKFSPLNRVSLSVTQLKPMPDLKQEIEVYINQKIRRFEESLPG